MEPIEFIKSCFAITCVLIAFAIFIKVSFALVDWLVERIKEDTLKPRIKRELMNAEQMFDKLGYTRVECGDPMYRKKDDPWTWIDFSGSGVAVSVENGLGHKYLSSELIEAISQQMKELG